MQTASQLYWRLIQLYFLLRLHPEENINKKYLQEIIALKKTLRDKKLVPNFLPKILRAHHFMLAQIHQLTILESPYYYWRGWFDYRTFLSWSKSPRRILLIEGNHGHNEVAESMANNFLRLGYQVDFITYHKNAPERSMEYILDKKKFRALFTSSKGLRLIVKSRAAANYQMIFYNSVDVYVAGRWWSNVKKFYAPHPKNSALTAGICHNGFTLADNESLFDQTFLPGALPQVVGRPEKIIYPLDFGYIKKDQHRLTKTRKFIVVGALDQRRRDAQGLFEAVRLLKKRGHTNFKITTIGFVVHTVVPNDIAEFFDVRGRISYPDMYDLINQSDFVLALLNPTFEFHQNYIKRSVTGNYLTSYTFAKPLLVHDFFAKTYNFNHDNSLLYNSQKSLADGLAGAMTKALSMSNADYQKMCNLLAKQKQVMIEKSLQALQKALAKEA